MSKKVDLHTHSIASKDGSLSELDYIKALQNHKLDYIAITDHNTVDFALNLVKKMPKQIIVGEEIMTDVGEIIGLYLHKTIKPGLTLQKTIQEIKNQNGLVYIPHPFERKRHGLKIDDLKSIINHIDIVECYNGRTLAFQNFSKIKRMVNKYHLIEVASSDSHGRIGFCQTFTEIDQDLTRNNILEVLKTASFHYRPAGLMARLYPTINRLKK